jgi:hypothetical protein
MEIKEMRPKAYRGRASITLCTSVTSVTRFTRFTAFRTGEDVQADMMPKSKELAVDSRLVEQAFRRR